MVLESPRFFVTDFDCLSSDKERMSDTCDNCLRWAGSMLRQVIDSIPAPSLSSCGGCKVVRYCSRVSLGNHPQIYWHCRVMDSNE